MHIFTARNPIVHCLPLNFLLVDTEKHLKQDFGPETEISSICLHTFDCHCQSLTYVITSQNHNSFIVTFIYYWFVVFASSKKSDWTSYAGKVNSFMYEYHFHDYVDFIMSSCVILRLLVLLVFLLMLGAAIVFFSIHFLHYEHQLKGLCTLLTDF